MVVSKRGAIYSTSSRRRAVNENPEDSIGDVSDLSELDSIGRQLDFNRTTLACTADVPIRQPQKCRQCIRFYDPRFECRHLRRSDLTVP